MFVLLTACLRYGYYSHVGDVRQRVSLILPLSRSAITRWRRRPLVVHEAPNSLVYERSARNAAPVAGCSVVGPRSRIMHLIDPPPLARNSLTSTVIGSTARSRTFSSSA